MKLGFNLFLFLLALFSLRTESLSLTDYQIKRYCAKQEKVSSCIKDLQEKRANLQEGNLIEIPVFPYKN